MTKFKLLVIVLIFSGALRAGVKEKKAIRVMQEQVEDAVKPVRRICGTQKLKVTFELAEYKSFFEKNKAEIMKDNGKEAFLYDYAGRNTIAVLNALESICKKDVDYKNEISKVEVIKILPNESYTNNDSKFELEKDGKVIVSKLITNATLRDASSFLKDLKNIW